MLQEGLHRGKNIKIYDKIKLQHVQSGFRLHGLEHQWKNGSYNQAVSTHKTKDQSDWFVVLKASDDNQQLASSGISYHFQYGNSILLTSVSFKKYLHATNDFDSEISKNIEVSLCENGDGGPNCQEDVWKVTPVGSTYDEYWRVGQQIRIQSMAFGNFLCSHNKRLRESGENEVFVLKNSTEKVGSKQKKDEGKQQPNNSDLWIVVDIQPFLYTANLTQKKQLKKTDEAEQIQRLRKIKAELPKKNISSNNETQELLKLGNERLAQMENTKNKINQEGEKNTSWWRKICFCCPETETQGDYARI